MKKKHYLVAWHRVCRLKESGGLDFKELLSWNKALLSQHLLELQHSSAHSGSLWARWMRKYRVGTNSLWESTSKLGDSSFWKALVRLKDEIRQVAPMGMYTSMELTQGNVYDLLSKPTEEAAWHCWVWPKTRIPKVSFICWSLVLQQLVILNAVCVRRRLRHMSTCSSSAPTPRRS